MIVKEGWIGANSEEEAKEKINERYPGCSISKVYQKLSGMWAYEVTEKEQEDSAAVPFQDDDPPEDEPEELESEA